MRTPISCDTLVAMGDATIFGNLIFAKNSDRGLTESQPLELFPAAEHADGAKLKCTHIEIDQVPRTFRVIGSRPWWIWGFEHGVNERGVVIGNEAAGSQIDEEETDGLIGMDLLRLGLERGATAAEALDTIAGLLEKHGQGGSCAYGKKDTYHNLFIIADAREAWILETVNRRWVAKKVADYGCISNIYSIGANFDKSSADIEQFAVTMGLHVEGQPFDFAKSYTYAGGGASGFARMNRADSLLRKGYGKIDLRYVKGIMRDHFEGEIVAPRWSPTEAYNASICMHAARAGYAHTAASIILEAYPDAPPELAFTYWGCMCSPCLSVYTPYFNTGYLPPALSAGETDKYSDKSFWWKCFRLALAAEANYEKYAGVIRTSLDKLEEDLERKVRTVRGAATELYTQGAGDEATELLNSFMDRCIADAAAEIDRLIAETEADLARCPGQAYKAEYIRETKTLAQFP